MNADDVQSFNLDDIPLLPLLLQTGYLTIKSTQRRGVATTYTLGYPNIEVRQSLNNKLAEMNVNERNASRILATIPGIAGSLFN